MIRDVAVVGAGYVGLPLAVRLADAGQTVVCVDPDAPRIAQLNAGDSYIGDVTSEELEARSSTPAGCPAAPTRASSAPPRRVIICVPTPLTTNREPDLTYVELRRRVARAATCAAGRP